MITARDSRRSRRSARRRRYVKPEHAAWSPGDRQNWRSRCMCGSDHDNRGATGHRKHPAMIPDPSQPVVSVTPRSCGSCTRTATKNAPSPESPTDLELHHLLPRSPGRRRRARQPCVPAAVTFTAASPPTTVSRCGCWVTMWRTNDRTRWSICGGSWGRRRRIGCGADC